MAGDGRANTASYRHTSQGVQGFEPEPFVLHAMEIAGIGAKSLRGGRASGRKSLRVRVVV